MQITSSKSLIILLNNAIEHETRLRNDIGWRYAQLGWILIIIQMVILVTALIIGFISYAAECPFLAELSIYALLLYYLVVLVTPIVAAWTSRQSIMNAMLNPAGFTISWNARLTAAIDTKIFPKIMRHSLDDIEFTLLEARSEKDNFERRMSLIIGAIDKTGIFPGLLSALVLWQKLPDDNITPWITAVAYSIAILYFFGLRVHLHTMRLDRLLKLLDLAVARKKAALTGIPSRLSSAAAEG